MSSPIWTPAALSSELRPYAGTCWRVVEAQHRVSTLKLVDTLDEQAVLEAVVEETKPAVPPDCAHLDYLLSTPFRYGAPYPSGSRFRRPGYTDGVYYASETPRTAIAELVFRRLLFFADSPATPFPDDAAEHTVFSAALETQRSLDLAKPPLVEDEARWMDRTDYGACQDLADALRRAQGDLIRYRSVRDREGGMNVAVLACRAFAASHPGERQTWRIRLGAHGAQAVREHPRTALEFPPEAFDDPRLDGFAWSRPRR